jgi:serine/threonine-protein kinase ULK2
LLKKKRRMSESETVNILKDIVNGFVEMGDRRFLHRDLKLANIFMNNGNAIIADFGFAKKNK